MALFLSIYVIGVIGFLVHTFMLPSRFRTSSKLTEIFLLYQLVFSLGLTSLIAFLGLTFLDKYIAGYTGWPASPFEQQLANVNLGFSVLGFLSIWYRGYFWMATILGFSIWILSDGIHHLYKALVEHNFKAGNVGVPLYTDFAIPLVLLISLYFYLRNFNTGKDTHG